MKKGVKLTPACKRRLLARLNAAWTLSKDRPVDVEVADEKKWRITYRHSETGEVSVSLLYKSELLRQEANMQWRAGGNDA